MPKLFFHNSGGGGGGVLMIVKYGRCDTAPFMCDREKDCAHP